MTSKIIKMKLHFKHTIINRAACLMLAISVSFAALAQEVVTEEPVKKTPAKAKPVKNTFNSIWIIDNQTVMVPQKKTFEMDIMHRFGTINKGYDDFWGMFAPSNIRIGVSYAPINKLNIGLGITKSNMLWDVSAKYAIIQQTKSKYPVSITYYGNLSRNTTKDADGIFKYDSWRNMYFNQIIIARKITERLSLQVAPSISHQNYVDGYYKRVDSVKKVVEGQMENTHFAISFAGRYNVTNVTSIIFNYDQPITKHVANNPRPNISFGFEFNTSNHAFQLFMGNYYYLSPQRNNLFNKNDFKEKQFLIGFNMTRLWNY
jgi:hypothetical protein